VLIFLITLIPTIDAIHVRRHQHKKEIAALEQQAKTETATKDVDVWLVAFGGSHGSGAAEMSRAWKNQLYKRNGHVAIANANLATLIAAGGTSQAVGYSPLCAFKNAHCASLLFGKSQPAKITDDRAEFQEVAKGGGENNGGGGWWMCEVHAKSCDDTCWGKIQAEMGEPAKGDCINCTYNFPANYGTLVNLNDQDCRDHWCHPDAKTHYCYGTCFNCNLFAIHHGIVENPDSTGVHTYWMRKAHKTGSCYCYKGSAIVDNSECANQMAKNVKDDVPETPLSTDITILQELRDPHMEKALKDFDMEFEF